MRLLVAKLHRCKNKTKLKFDLDFLTGLKNSIKFKDSIPWVRCDFDNVYTGYQCFTVTFSAAVAALSCLPSLSLRVVVALCPPTASFCSSDKALGANKSHVF